MVYCKEGLCLDPGSESFLIGNSAVGPLDQKIAEVLLYIYIYLYIYFIISNEQSKSLGLSFDLEVLRPNYLSESIHLEDISTILLCNILPSHI